MWGLVAGVVVWQKFTPKRVAAAPVEVTQTLPDPLPVEVEKAPEVFPPPKRVEEPVKKLDPAVTKALADGGKLVLQAIFAGKGEDDRPLVDPPAQDAVAKVKKIPDGCKTYETAIHFMKNLETAQKKAKADDRLVFVLHLSGNIEDPGFT